MNYEAISFLDKLRPNGPHLLASMPPDKSPVCRMFDKAEDAKEWLEKNEDVAGLYYHVGIPRGDIGNKRAARKDMRFLDYFWIDLDLSGKGTATELAEEKDELLRKIREYDKVPTWIINTGNGYQVLWKLDEPITADEAGEAKVRLITKWFGADHCSNTDRLLRLPGTTNYPNASKREKGRVEEKTNVIEHNERSYPADEFTAEVVVREASVSEAVTFDCIDDIDLPGSTLVLIEHGHDPDEPDANRNKTRSHAVWAVVCEMVRHKKSDEEIYGVITDPKFGISGHVLQQNNSHKYALRQITQARKEIGKERDGFVLDDKGRIIHRLYHNARVALSRLGVSPKFNELTSRYVIDGKDFNDDVLEMLLERCQKEFNITFLDKLLRGTIVNISHENTYHPVRDYLEMLPDWDEKPRLDRWLTNYTGAEDTPFNRAVGRIVLLAAVNRAMKPGCKFDEMMILEGVQGLGKSGFFEALIPRREWFSDHCPLDATAKDFIEATQGKWVMEVAELENFKRTDVERLKAVLSRKTDRARMAYARTAQDRPRGFIIVGSTNSSKYLVDPTGNRRFWPVKVGTLKIDELRRDREQLWAEAVTRRSESIRLDSSLWKDATKVQMERTEEDPLKDQLAVILGDTEGKIRPTSLYEVLDIPTPQRTPIFAIRLGRVMESLGWTRERRTDCRFWRRGKGGMLVAGMNGKLRLEKKDEVL